MVRLLKYYWGDFINVHTGHGDLARFVPSLLSGKVEGIKWAHRFEINSTEGKTLKGHVAGENKQNIYQ